MEALAKVLEIIFDLRPRKLFVLLVLICLLASVYPFFHRLFVEPYQLNQRAELLSKLSQLDLQKVNSDPQLKQVFQQILAQASAYQPLMVPQFPKLNLLSESPTTGWEHFFKFLSGGGLFFLLLLIVPVAEFDSNADRNRGIVLVIILGIVLGAGGLAIPTFSYTFVNYLGFPRLQLLIASLIAYLVISFRRKKSAAAQGHGA